MSIRSVFEFEDYKTFLTHVLESAPGKGRGIRSRWAEALRCHLTYISQVLNGEAHFNVEQIEALSRHLGLSEDEMDHLLLLQNLARAGTPQLRDHYLRKLTAAKEQRLILKNRLKFSNTLTEQDRAQYYSAWYYSALHVLVSVPSLQTPEAMSRHLGLSLAKTRMALEFLERVNLVQKKGAVYEYGAGNLHLPSDSPLIAKHHANWRVQSLRSLEDESAEDLHYSSVVTLSKRDIPRIKEAMIEAVQKIRGVVTDSPEEDIFCYSLDLFDLKRR